MIGSFQRSAWEVGRINFSALTSTHSQVSCGQTDHLHPHVSHPTPAQANLFLRQALRKTNTSMMPGPPGIERVPRSSCPAGRTPAGNFTGGTLFPFDPINLAKASPGLIHLCSSTFAVIRLSVSTQIASIGSADKKSRTFFSANFVRASFIPLHAFGYCQYASNRR
jgi:hypothetical protein